MDVTEKRLISEVDTPASCEGDLTLWRDLLRRARGDANLALKWMGEIGVNTPTTNNPGLQKDFDLAAAEAGAPATFYCPISFRVFRDPVMVPTGQTYERQYLDRWLSLGNPTCPATGQRLEPPVVVTPNVALRKSIEEWCATHVPWILDPEGRLKPIEPDQPSHFSKTLDACQQRANGSDLALAISLQEDELENFSARSRETQRQASRNSRRRTQRRKRSGCSVLTCLLLAGTAASTAVYILSLWQGSWQIENLSVNPLVGPSATALSRLGSRVSGKIAGQHQWWRIPASLFVSSGVIHLFSAITSLWTLGKYLESSSQLWLPWLSVPLVFFGSGIAGAVASTSLAFDEDSAGASAGVCGLLGAVWMEQLLNFGRYKNHLATLVVLAALTGMFVVLSLLPFVGLWYQVVSLACGALLLPAMLVPRESALAQGASKRWRCMAWAAKLACVAIVAGVIAVGVVSVLVDDARVARRCTFCERINCADTRWWSCRAVQPLQAQASCGFEQNSDATTTVTCPSGSTHAVPTSSLSDRIQACNMACSTVVAFAPPPLGPNSAGVLI